MLAIGATDALVTSFAVTSAEAATVSTHHSATKADDHGRHGRHGGHGGDDAPGHH